jgi:hypothetical protein
MRGGWTMLVTKLGHKVVGGPYVWASNTQAWRTVTLELMIPYILVTVQYRETDYWQSETSIFWRDEDVLALCREARATNSQSKVKRIALLLPPSSRRRATWRVRAVWEIWSRSRDVSDQTISYFGKNGVRLGSTANSDDPDDKGTLEYAA